MWAVQSLHKFPGHHWLCPKWFVGFGALGAEPASGWVLNTCRYSVRLTTSLCHPTVPSEDPIQSAHLPRLGMRPFLWGKGEMGTALSGWSSQVSRPVHMGFRCWIPTQHLLQSELLFPPGSCEVPSMSSALLLQASCCALQQFRAK